MRMLCDNTKSFHPLSHYGSARKARIDRIISEKFHAPAINAASSELLEEKTNKSDAEFQEWDITRSYVYILDRMSSFVKASNQHNDATPTYWETRANPAELDIILVTAPTQLGRDSRPREFGVVLKMDWLSSNGAQIDYKGKKVKIRIPNGKEIVIKGQRQTQKFLNIAQAKQLLRKDSKAYLAYVAGTKREAPIIPMRKNNHTYGSRNFLGINRFYERFVQDFAKISGPLTRPTCKTEKVVWNAKCEESFQELKRSLHGKVVAYASRQLKEYEKELNRRQRRWLELMKDYVDEILYHLGKANVVADALSSKERLKMLTTPEELVREIEEMEMEAKSPVKGLMDYLRSN
ncbi:hypothetical protein AgCh_022000 [Apium graveolens]